MWTEEKVEPPHFSTYAQRGATSADAKLLVASALLPGGRGGLVLGTSSPRAELDAGPLLPGGRAGLVRDGAGRNVPSGYGGAR